MVEAFIASAVFYTVLGIVSAAFVKLLRANGDIRTRKMEARWLLLCIVWPLIPVIGVFWIVGTFVFWTWESVATLIHDAQFGKRD